MNQDSSIETVLENLQHRTHIFDTIARSARRVAARIGTGHGRTGGGGTGGGGETGGGESEIVVDDFFGYPCR